MRRPTTLPDRFSLSLLSPARMFESSPATAVLIVVTLLVVAAASIWPVVERLLEARTDVLASGQLWRAVTYVFPHDAGWPHVIVNMALLYALGPPIERLLGGRGFVATYFVTGALGLTLLFAFAPPGRSGGASLSIYGILAAATVVHAIAGDHASAVRVGGVTIVLLVLSGLVTIGGVGTAAAPGLPGYLYGVAVHAAGIAAGGLVGLVLASSAPRPIRAAAVVGILVLAIGDIAIGVIRARV